MALYYWIGCFNPFTYQKGFELSIALSGVLDEICFNPFTYQKGFELDEPIQANQLLRFNPFTYQKGFEFTLS